MNKWVTISRMNDILVALQYQRIDWNGHFADYEPVLWVRHSTLPNAVPGLLSSV